MCILPSGQGKGRLGGWSCVEHCPHLKGQPYPAQAQGEVPGQAQGEVQEQALTGEGLHRHSSGE